MRAVVLFVFLLSISANGGTLKVTQPNPKGFAIDFELGHLVAEAVRTNGRRVTKLENRGASFLGRPGHLRLPRYGKLLVVPPGKELRVTEVSRKSRILRISAPISRIAPPKTHCVASRDFDPITPHVDLPLWQVGDVSFAGPVAAQLLTIVPVKKVGTGRMEVFDRLKLKVEFVPAKRKRTSPVGGLGPEIRPVFESTFGLNMEGRSRPIDLLIVHEKYKGDPAYFRFLTHKYRMGREVRTKYVKSPTPESVRKIIRAESRREEAPDHVILIGSIDQIPSFRRGKYWSDYPYALLDRGDLPDISVARIPVRSGRELFQLVEKVKARAKIKKPNRKILLTSGYDKEWCHENLSFIEENIFAKSKNKLTIQKVYSTDKKTTADFIDAYNSEPGLIIYDGHGIQKGMKELPLYIEHLSQLKNKTYPLLFDIACLNSYWPDQGDSEDNFAQKIVTLDRAGPAGILSASYYSNGHDFFRHMFRGAIFNEKTGGFLGLNSIGAVVLYGKINYLEEANFDKTSIRDNQMFYYHGDPASRLF